MKVLPSSPSILVTAAHAALYAGSRLVPTAAMACDESIFEATPSAVLVNKTTNIYVGLGGNCTGEGLFQMPRMTWTIEPNPDDSVTTTSVYLSPSNVGTVVTDESSSYIQGIQIDRDAVANAAEVAVLIQAPKDGLGSVNIENGAPFFVNIVKGFTDLTSIYMGVGSTCNPVRGSYIEADCPQCKDLYTPEEVRGIGPSVVADLSDVKFGRTNIGDNMWTFIRSIFVVSDGVYNLSLALPEYGENGAPVQFNFGGASSKVEIKGNFDCAFEDTDMTTGGRCVFRTSGAPGCKDCSNELIVDGSFNGYFNVSADNIYGSSPLNAEMSGDGCDRLVPYFYDDSVEAPVSCSEGNVTVDVEPFPCISADIGTVECGADPDYGRERPCFCVVPMPASECKDQPSTGLSLSADWIVYLSLPIVGVFLAL